MRLYVDDLPKDCWDCPMHDGENGRCKMLVCYTDYIPKDCPLQSIFDYTKQVRKEVVGELIIDIRSLFNSYASSLIDYCIWNKNADENQKLYNNFKRIINDRLKKVLELFDKRIYQIQGETNE